VELELHPMLLVLVWDIEVVAVAVLAELVEIHNQIFLALDRMLAEHLLDFQQFLEIHLIL
jgi:hypothetical protein